MAAESGDTEKSIFRWLDAARYAVASVVTVLIVVVIANAVKMVLRPESIYVSVLGGSVFSKRIPMIPPCVNLNINIRTQNPKDRAVMYLVNVTGYLFDENTLASSPRPKYDSICLFPLKDVTLLQGMAVDSFLDVTVTKKKMDPAYFGLLYGGNGSSISDVTLRLDGTLITEVRSGTNPTARPTTYYCRPLLVGGDPDDRAFRGNQDVLCSDVQGSTRRHALYYLLLACMVALIIQTL